MSDESSILKVLKAHSDSAQRNLLKVLEIVDQHQLEIKREMTPLQYERENSLQLKAIPFKAFKYGGLEEIDVWRTLEILRRIYLAVQKPPKGSGVLAVHHVLPKPEIITTPDDKKWVGGFDRETVAEVRKVLSQRYGDSKLLEEKRPEPPPQKPIKVGDSYPKPVVKGGRGYVQFHPHRAGVFAGGSDTRKFKLVKGLLLAANAFKTVESVFDACKLEKDKYDQSLTGINAEDRKRQIIDRTISELQGMNGLRGKIFLEYKDGYRRLRLRFR